MPSFHDGEILGLTLDRDCRSILRVRGWIATDRVGPDDALVLEHLPTCRIVLADKGYDTDATRRQIEAAGATPNIPPKINRRW